MLNGDSLDARIMHDACTRHMSAVCAQPEG
jgi:hypothetical protein